MGHGTGYGTWLPSLRNSDGKVQLRLATAGDSPSGLFLVEVYTEIIRKSLAINRIKSEYTHTEKEQPRQAKEKTEMKTIYKLEGKKISKKALIEKMGAERVKRMTEEAWETTMEDPYISNDFMTGNGMLNISFEG
jgi:hypothetical protein